MKQNKLKDVKIKLPIKVEKEFVLKLHKEKNPRKTDYKMFATVKGLPGCFLVGDTKAEVIKCAKQLIPAFASITIKERKNK